MFYPSRFSLLIIMKKLSKDYYFELAQFCMDYHGGQWSRGYRLMCRLRPSNFSSSLSEELRESEAYQWLVANYAEKI
jgi:hypothetical protein